MSDVYTLYSDFNCPFCYALYELLQELQFIDRCEWRGVQHASHLSNPMHAGGAPHKNSFQRCLVTVAFVISII